MTKKIISVLTIKGFKLMIQIYQVGFSLFFGPCCRFIPSCSSYTSLSVQRFGLARGCWVSIKRLCRCHPFHPGGFDPVPGADKNP